MTERKKKDKKSKKAARTQSCLQQVQVSPDLPSRPHGGLPPRASFSFDGDPHSLLSSSLPRGFTMDSSDTPPPIPTTPRPRFSIAKPPAPLPPLDDEPPPLPPPLVAPAHSKRQQSTPTTPCTPGPTSPSSPAHATPSSSAPSRDPRYIERSSTAAPSINANTVLSEEQLRVQIELQTQNTEELRELLKGKEEEAMTPVVLAGKYGKYFPFKVTVMKGFYNNRAEIVAGEIYNVHFLKNARVIAIADSAGQKYVLPLNAAMRIGFEQRNQPDTYYNIIDIINSTEPPKLISPRDDYRGNEGNSLTHDEVLLVKGVHVSRVRRLKSLNVVNMKTGEEKRIPSDCQVHFSTEPIYTQLTLSDAVHKVPELIPGSARLYPTVDAEDMGFPGHLVSETVRVRRQYIERSIITTLEEQEPRRPLDPFSLSTEPEEQVNTIYDLPLSLDIEFAIIPPEPEEDLYAYTHQLSQQFDPRKLQSGDGLGLNMALDEENIYSGVELELPPYINYDPNAPTFILPAGLSEPSVPPPLPARRPSQQEGEDYSEIGFTSTVQNSDRPPLPLPNPSPSSSLPPPLPSSHPPSSRPSSASSRPIPTPRASSPLASPKPKKKAEAKPKPHPPVGQPHQKAVNGENDEYVDIEEELSLRGIAPPLSSSSSSSRRPPYKYPQVTLLTKNTPQVTTSTDSAPPSGPTPLDTGGAGGGGKRKERSVVSPASSGGSYEDTASLVEEMRPRLPIPHTSTSASDTGDDHEIMQQFSDLLSVIQNARKLVERRQQQSSVSQTTAELRRLRDDLKRVQSFPQKIVNHCIVLERELTGLKEVVSEEMVKASSSEAVEENRQFLSTLSVAQTMQMLERMNLQKYQGRFAEEGVDGAILMDIEENTLETELGITSKLDRVKLMKIIKGERSAKSVLEGQYNYVALQPRSN